MIILKYFSIFIIIFLFSCKKDKENAVLQVAINQWKKNIEYQKEKT